MFVDSAWWHGHPSRWRPGRHPPQWDDKIRANRARDEQVNAELAAAGWTVVRIWGFELAADLDGAVRRVAEALAAAD